MHVLEGKFDSAFASWFAIDISAVVFSFGFMGVEFWTLIFCWVHDSVLDSPDVVVSVGKVDLSEASHDFCEGTAIIEVGFDGTNIVEGPFILAVEVETELRFLAALYLDL